MKNEFEQAESGTSKAQCIYCLDVKNRSEFNKEHVIHSSMTGSFQPINLTLIHTVCKDCNQAMGDTFDMALGRGYWEGLARFQHEMKDPRKVKELSTENIEFHVDDEEAFRNDIGEFEDIAADHLRLELLNGSIVRLTRKQLIMRPLEEHVDLKEVKGFRIFSASDESNDKIAALCTPALANAGFEINSVYKHAVTATVTYDLIAFRAFAKVAFNYFAKITENSPELALAEPFDEIRSFVRYGHRPTYQDVELLGENLTAEFDGRPMRGHWITLSVHGGSRLVAELSLFNRHQWRVILCQNMRAFQLPSDLVSTHVWDMRTMRCEAIEASRLNRRLP